MLLRIILVITSTLIAPKDPIKPFLKNAKYINIKTNAIANVIGDITAKAPKLVATPLPPLNLEKHENICPNTVERPSTYIAKLLFLKTNIPIRAKPIPFARYAS